MGVYIKGMEMPKEFDPDVYIELACGIDGKRYARLYNFHIGGLTEWCEVIPVPPHGRLGDLDKLVEKIDGIWDCNDMVFKPDDHCCNVPEDCKGCKWVQTKDCIQRMVENAPTIIPADHIGDATNMIPEDGGKK